jgi:ferredoxin-NADP reductase
VPGQATEVAINKPDWTQEKRPFTFTNLPDEDHLEFTIKTYSERKGITHELFKLSEGDELILHEVWGSILYKGKGVFLAGGAGITPFISIIRHLENNKEIAEHLLIFANKTHEDIIMEDEFNSLLNGSFVNILSDEKAEGYFHGMITQDFLQEHIDNFDRKFYVCGPLQ